MYFFSSENMVKTLIRLFFCSKLWMSRCMTICDCKLSLTLIFVSSALQLNIYEIWTIHVNVFRLSLSSFFTKTTSYLHSPIVYIGRWFDFADKWFIVATPPVLAPGFYTTLRINSIRVNSKRW